MANYFRPSAEEQIEALAKAAYAHKKAENGVNWEDLPDAARTVWIDIVGAFCETDSLMTMLLQKYQATVGWNHERKVWLAMVPAQTPVHGEVMVTAAGDTPFGAIFDLDTAIMASEQLAEGELATDEALEAAEEELRQREVVAGIARKEEKLAQIEETAGEIVNEEERAHFLFNRASAINHAIATVDQTIRAMRDAQNANPDMPMYMDWLAIVVVQKKNELSFLAKRLKSEFLSHRNTEVVVFTEDELSRNDNRLVYTKAVAVIHSSLVDVTPYKAVINTSLTEKVLNVSDLYYEVNVQRIDELCGTHLVDQANGNQPG